MRCVGGRPVSVVVASTRPFVASRLLAGRSATEACRLVPTLFSVCGGSQAVAAVAAIEAAFGRVPGARALAARQHLVAVEVIQEGLFQAIVEWPRAWGVAEDEHALRAIAAARRRTSAAGEALAASLLPGGEVPDGRVLADAQAAARAAIAPCLDAVLGTAARERRSQATAEEADDWIERGATPTARALRAARAEASFGASEVAALPAADATLVAEIAREMDGRATFEASPSWRGAPAETGALARTASMPTIAAGMARWGRSALLRCLARLLELGAFAAGERRPAVGASPLGRGEGIGWVETARGLLLHRVRLAGDRVDDYRIVAPTEWNFHPQGALASGLRRAVFTDAASAERGARWLLQSLDPCIAARVEVAHA